MNAIRARAGFTLIEVLVVITIVGIVLSMAVLSLGLIGENKELDTEVRRYVSLVELARDESMMQGREYGLEVLQQGYRFVELDPLTRQWTEILGDDVLRARSLPETIELELFIEDKQIPLEYDAALLNSGEEDDDRLEQFQPHVFIFSSGDMTPFELRFRQPINDERVILTGDLFGKIELLDEESL